MFLFRAMSDKDIENYYNSKNIFCTLANSFFDIDNRDKNEQNKIRLCCSQYFNDTRENALNGMIGHVSGAKFKCDRSPWISTSSDFRFVACEYAVPQAGKYNWFNKRRPIVLIDYDDDKIYDENAKIFKLRKENNKDFAVDLRDNKLKELYDLDIIENETTFGYTWTNGTVLKNKIDGINNFATGAKEILIFGEIKRNDIKLVIYPVLQDILYSCNIDINSNYDFIMKNGKKINKIISDMINDNSFFKLLYPDLKTGIPLTDILEENYSKISGNDIESKYMKLKELKYKELSLLVANINKKLHTNWVVNDLVDNKIIVCNYTNIKKYTDRQLNDIILIERNNDVYRYSHDEKAYVSENSGVIKVKR